MASVILAMVVLLAGTVATHADESYKFVKYHCNQIDDYIELEYFILWNERGENQSNNLDDNTWVPWSWFIMKDNDHIGVEFTEERECMLSDGLYLTVVGPLRGNWNIQGECGAWASAWFAVAKSRFDLLIRENFEDHCRSRDRRTTVLRRVRIGGGYDEPYLEFVTPEQFREEFSYTE
jgi:hypothetical protein